MTSYRQCQPLLCLFIYFPDFTHSNDLKLTLPKIRLKNIVLRLIN